MPADLCARSVVRHTSPCCRSTYSDSAEQTSEILTIASRGQDMVICEMKVRLITLVATVSCLASLTAAASRAQNVTVTPNNPPSLTFGVPSVGSTSIPQPITISVTGSGTASVNSITPGGANAGDFTQTNNCSTPITAPGACTINVTFKPSGTGLESATLTFNVVTGQLSTPFTITFTGAAGAIKLFTPIIIAKSNGNASLPNPFTFGSITLTLTATNVPLTAILSSSPDGSGNVFVDNFFSLAINKTPVGTGNPPGNVCPGPASDTFTVNEVTTTDLDCFTEAYRSAANTNNELDGKNPDTFVNSGNNVLDGAAGGVGPIDVKSFLSSLVPGEGGTPTPTPVTFTLLDGGGKVGSSTIFLVTNATVNGVQTGGTVSGNPINPNDPGTQIQQFTFDSAAKQHVALSADYLALDGSPQIVNGTTPLPFDTGLTQSQFATMVKNTSAGPTVCMRLTGELAADQVTPLCKAFTLVCTQPGVNTPAGVNCPQQLATAARNLLFTAAFDTPDPITIAPGTGPGFLMGQDNWASAGPNLPATPQACSFGTNPATDPLANQLCPQDTLTSFIGTGDPIPGGTARTTNSTFVPVLNMPLPFTIPVVTSGNIFGWQQGQSATVTVRFFAIPAIYPFFFNFNPLPANGFTAAPIQSVTFGTTPATSPVPDTTFPIPTDTTLFNTGTCPTTTPGVFETPSSSFVLMEGRYNLHFFATDCASTEELRFTPQNSPTANWASFKTVPIRIDGKAPAIGGPGPSNTPTASLSGNTVTVTYNCSDPTLQDGTAGSGVVVCGTHLFFAVPSTPTLTSTFKTSTRTGIITLKATDLAGNTTSVNVSY
jgi:hypothetical protein